MGRMSYTDVLEGLPLRRPACLECGDQDPRPDQECPITPSMYADHFVGTEAGCGHCGRLVEACKRRPCSARRET